MNGGALPSSPIRCSDDSLPTVFGRVCVYSRSLLLLDPMHLETLILAVEFWVQVFAFVYADLILSHGRTVRPDKCVVPNPVDPP